MLGEDLLLAAGRAIDVIQNERVAVFAAIADAIEGGNQSGVGDGRGGGHAILGERGPRHQQDEQQSRQRDHEHARRKQHIAPVNSFHKLPPLGKTDMPADLPASTLGWQMQHILIWQQICRRSKHNIVTNKLKVNTFQIRLDWSL